MKKLLILLRVYCRGLLRRQAGKNGLRGRLGTAGFAALLLLGWAGIAGYTVALGFGLNAIGMLNVYPMMVVTLEALLTLMTAIAHAPGTLFRGRDFDLVMSLPLPGWTVAASRLLELYAYELLYTLVVMLPAGVTYCVLARCGAAAGLIYFVSMLFVPMLPVLLGAALGGLAHVVGSAFRGSRVVSLALTFAFTAAVVVGSYSIGFIFEDYTPAQFMDLANMVSRLFARMYPPAKLFSRAVTGPDWGAFAAFAGLSLGAFALLAGVFGHWFTALNTLVNARHTRGDFRFVRQEARSVSRALLRREVKRYFSSNLYVMNTAFGLVLSLIGAIALQFYGIDRLAVLMELSGQAQFLFLGVPFLAAFMAATCSTTSSSISLEGRQLWQVLSLPVPARDYLMAKVKLNLLVSLPFVLAVGALLARALRVTPLAAALALALPLAVAVFSAQFGLLCNLKWHRFDWTNEATVIKQSLAAALPPLVGVALCVIPLPLMIFVPALDHALVPLLTLAVFALADVALYLRITRRAEMYVRRLTAQ